MKKLETVTQITPQSSTITVPTPDHKQSPMGIIAEIGLKYDKAMQGLFSFNDSYDDQLLEDIQKTALETLELFNQWISAPGRPEGNFTKVYTNLIIVILAIIRGYSNPEVIYFEKLKYMNELLRKLDEIAKRYQPVSLDPTEYSQILKLILDILDQVKFYSNTSFRPILITITSCFKEQGETSIQNLELLTLIQNPGESKEVKYISPLVIKSYIPRIQNSISIIIKELNLKSSTKKLSKRPVVISSLHSEAVRAQTLSDQWDNQTAENICVEHVSEVFKFLILGLDILHEQNDKSILLELITEITDYIHQICLIFDNHPLLFNSWLASKYYRVHTDLNQETYKKVLCSINEVLLLQPKSNENKFYKLEILIRILRRFLAVSKQVMSSTSVSIKIGLLEILFRTADQALNLYLNENLSAKIFQKARSSKTLFYFNLFEITLSVVSLCFTEPPARLKSLYVKRMEMLFFRLKPIAAHHKEIEMLESYYERLLKYIIEFADTFHSFPIRELILSIGRELTSSPYPLNITIQYYQTLINSQKDQKTHESQSLPIESKEIKLNINIQGNLLIRINEILKQLPACVSENNASILNKTLSDLETSKVALQSGKITAETLSKSIYSFLTAMQILPIQHTLLKYQVYKLIEDIYSSLDPADAFQKCILRCRIMQADYYLEQEKLDTTEFIKVMDKILDTNILDSKHEQLILNLKCFHSFSKGFKQLEDSQLKNEFLIKMAGLTDKIVDLYQSGSQPEYISAQIVKVLLLSAKFSLSIDKAPARVDNARRTLINLKKIIDMFDHNIVNSENRSKIIEIITSSFTLPGIDNKILALMFNIGKEFLPTGEIPTFRSSFPKGFQEDTDHKSIPDNKIEIKDKEERNLSNPPKKPTEIKKNGKKVNNSSKQIKITEKAISELKAKIARLTKSNKETQIALGKKNDNIEKLHNQLDIANEQMSELENQFKNHKKQSSETELRHTNEISSYKDKNDHLIAQIKSQKTKIEKLNVQIEQQQAEIKEQKKTIEKNRTEMRSQKQSLGEAQKNIAALKGQNAQLKDQLSLESEKHTEALRAAEAQIANLQAELEKVKFENEAKSEIIDLTAKLKNAHRTIGQKNRELLFLLQEQKNYQRALAEYERIVTRPVIVQTLPQHVILLPQWHPGFTYASPHNSYNSNELSEPPSSQVGTGSGQEVTEWPTL